MVVEGRVGAPIYEELGMGHQSSRRRLSVTNWFLVESGGPSRNIWRMHDYVHLDKCDHYKDSRMLIALHPRSRCPSWNSDEPLTSQKTGKYFPWAGAARRSNGGDWRLRWYNPAPHSPPRRPNGIPTSPSTKKNKGDWGKRGRGRGSWVSAHWSWILVLCPLAEDAQIANQLLSCTSNGSSGRVLGIE